MTKIELITMGRDISVAAAALVTATVAILGLNKWQDELRGKAGFEVARALIRATYKLRDAIQDARGPLIRSAEFPSTYSGLGKHSPEEDAQAWNHVYRKRWKPVVTALREFDTAALEAEALWSSRIRDRTAAVRKCAGELWLGIEALIENAASGGANFESDKRWAMEMRALVAASSMATDNALSSRIAAAVADLENELKQHLSRK